MNTTSEIVLEEPEDQIFEQFRQEQEEQVKAMKLWLWGPL